MQRCLGVELACLQEDPFVFQGSGDFVSEVFNDV